ncbi:hypothetical protein GCM10010304_82540 [Streptomyces roseoviolaceus]
MLQNTASLGIFWLFVGFGRGKLAFYKSLNASTSATFTNVAFYDASKCVISNPFATELGVSSTTSPGATTATAAATTADPTPRA